MHTQQSRGDYCTHEVHTYIITVIVVVVVLILENNYTNTRTYTHTTITSEKKTQDKPTFFEASRLLVFCKIRSCTLICSVRSTLVSRYLLLVLDPRVRYLSKKKLMKQHHTSSCSMMVGGVDDDDDDQWR